MSEVETGRYLFLHREKILRLSHQLVCLKGECSSYLSPASFSKNTNVEMIQIFFEHRSISASSENTPWQQSAGPTFISLPHTGWENL